MIIKYLSKSQYYTKVLLMRTQQQPIVKQQQVHIEQCKQSFLIVVYGLPASGKTTFARNLKQSIFPQALLISADEIEHQTLANKAMINQLQEQSPENLIKKLDQLHENSAKNRNKPAFQPQNWKNSRKLVEKVVQKIIRYKPVIVEDDLLLNSQRKPFRKLSFIYHLPYLEILMDSTVQQCLINLHSRVQQVNGCVVTNEVIQSSGKKLQKFAEGLCLKLADRKISRQQIQARWKIIQIHANNPDDPVFQQNKAKHTQTAIQQNELKIRSYIHELMSLSPEDLQSRLGDSIKNRQNVGILLSNWKKQFMKEVRKRGQLSPEQHLIDYLSNIK